MYVAEHTCQYVCMLLNTYVSMCVCTCCTHMHVHACTCVCVCVLWAGGILTCHVVSLTCYRGSDVLDCGLDLSHMTAGMPAYPRRKLNSPVVPDSLYSETD